MLKELLGRLACKLEFKLISKVLSALDILAMIPQCRLLFCCSTSHVAPYRHKDLLSVFDHTMLFLKAKPLCLLLPLSETFFPLSLASWTSIQVEVVKCYLPREAPTSSGSKAFLPLDSQEHFVHGPSHTAL